MLLLEMGAELNATDESEHTPVALAEDQANFELMDRLMALGGHGNRLHELWSKGKTRKEVKSVLGRIGQPKHMAKFNSLTRLMKLEG